MANKADWQSVASLVESVQLHSYCKKFEDCLISYSSSSLLTVSVLIPITYSTSLEKVVSNNPDQRLHNKESKRINAVCQNEVQDKITST